MELVGRTRELGELRDGLDAALSGRGSLFIVTGEPGVGKTALADAMAQQAQDAGALVLWGRAWEGGGAPAFWPWLRILRALAATRELAGAISGLGATARERVTRLVPELRADPLGASPSDAGPPDAGEAAEPTDAAENESARFALFDAITSLLLSACDDGPLVLVLDDLHAADRPSLLLLEFLAGELRTAPILVVGTLREAEARLHPQLADALAHLTRRGRRLPLRGLREGDVAELVERVSGERPGERAIKAIHSATEGNPFFVDEVVRLLSAEGSLTDAADPRAAVRIPDGVRETIRHRLDPLPDAAREALATAAVIGRDFPVATLQRVTELDQDELDAALGHALDAGVLVERPGALGRYGFSHGLIRETIYNDLGPQRRGRLHRAVGLALEELHAADVEPHLAELAHHFFEAVASGELARAIDYSVRAGERAMGLVAYEEAAGHFERALQTYGLEERADVPRRCDLLLALGHAQSLAGDAHGARDTFQRAAGLARQLDSPERLGRAALGYGAGIGGFEFGRVDEDLVALLTEARTALAAHGDSPVLARVLGRLATELYFSPRADERSALSEEAVAMARRLGNPAALASTLSARYLALWGPDDAEERAALAADVVALGEEVRNRELALRGHVWRVIALMELGDVVGADIELATHARLAEALRDPLHLCYVPLFRGMRAMLDGRLADAERLAGEALAIGRRTQSRNADQLFAVQMFELRTLQARVDEIEPQLADFARRYPAAPVWRAGLAFTHTELGRLGEARQALEPLLAAGLEALPRDGEWLAMLVLLTRACAALGDADGGALLADALEPYADRAVIAGRGAICLGPAARYAGLAAATAGRTDVAIAHYETALSTAQRWGAVPSAAATRADLADALNARGAIGDAARAAALRGDALAVAQRLGLAALASRLEGLAGDAAGIASVAATPPPQRAAFYRRGDIWTIASGACTFQLKDAKGLRHLARLLATPRVEIHALDLVGGSGGGGDAGPALDTAAKAAYRRRIEELEEEIDEADSFHDPERATRARMELEFVAQELAGAVGLGGRDRRTGSDTERARVNATRALRSALDRIADNDPELGRRLGRAVRTGTFCVYDPDPRDEVEWDLRGPGDER